MSKRIVLLDCDGVLAQTPQALVQLINSHFGTCHKFEDVRIHDVFTSFGLLAQRPVWYEYVKSKQFCLNLEPYIEAQEAVKELQTFCDVYCVTSPFNQSPWMHEREQWLGDHFKIHRDNVIQTSAKHLVFGNVFVDDYHVNITAWKKCWPDEQVVLFNSPYAVPLENVTTTSNWEEIINIVKWT